MDVKTARLAQWQRRVEMRLSDRALRRVLLACARRDQAARTAHRDGSIMWREVAAVDDANLEMLMPLLRRRGWLGSDVVGEDGAHAYWLLVQHAPPHLRDTALPLMADAVASGHASTTDLAYLADRVAVDAGRFQTYGTQAFAVGSETARLWPIIEPTAVNDRRIAVELARLTPTALESMWRRSELVRLGVRIVPPRHGAL